MKKIIFGASVLLCAACASVIDGNKQQLAFDSNEKDVEIYIDGALACRTPCLTEVHRANQKLLIVAKKEGYVDRSMFLDKNINATTAINIISLWTSTFGFSTDLTTGDIWEYQPNSIYVVMNKEPKTAKEQEELKKQNQVRDFVLRNFDALQSDLSGETSGEYIKSLEHLSGLSKTEIANVLQKSYLAPDCAERMIGLTLEK